MPIRVILAGLLLCAFGALTAISFTHVVRSRSKCFHMGVLLTSGLGSASMLVPNEDKDWLYLARILFTFTHIACAAILQRIIYRWFRILQHHSTQEIFLATLCGHFQTWNMFLLSGLALLTAYGSSCILTSILLMLNFLTCAAWLDGSLFARRESASLPRSVGYKPTADAVRPIDVSLFHMRWDLHSLHVPYDGSRILLGKMTQSLVVASVLLCASSAAHLTLYVICLRYTKLCDLDFEYIGFFLCHTIGTLPFLAMLTTPGFLSRFDASR
ncbi:hypothetical protein MNAN1_000814 [Malassezia nana]|uniref:Uncharacterized protein n=1 Tax=Malassezia nana TaxID=180528 RepID=A0AAF0EPI7_9BASI|nr:hypothetical protein MNAN1_000814 [Malassezia nana]